MGNSKFFNNLLTDIEPSKSTKSYVSSLQTNLRNHLAHNEQYKHIYKETFISGSFAKKIAIRPSVDDDKQDIDIIVITSYNKRISPEIILSELKDVLSQLSKYKEIRLQTKSIGINMANYHIDVVPVIIEDGQLWIGNREKNEWIHTEPKEHIMWSTDINKSNDGKYKALVKLLKWWKRNKKVKDIKLPKGILLEKIVADNIGNFKYDFENLLVNTLENIVDAYKDDYIVKGNMPIISDPILNGNNLADDHSFEDFKVFIELIEQDLENMRNAQFSTNAWKEVFGENIPRSIEEIQEEYSLYARSEMKNLLNEVIEKSQKLTINIEDYERIKLEYKKKEADLATRQEYIQDEINDLKYTLYIDFLREVSSLSNELIKSIGREYWVERINVLKDINVKKKRNFKGYEYSCLARIYKALELYKEFYFAICEMVRDRFYLSSHEVKDVISKTPYRTTLIDLLEDAINYDDYSKINESFKEALLLLKSNRH